MPAYVYKCPNCGREVTKVVRHEDRSQPQACPGCGHQMDRDMSLEQIAKTPERWVRGGG